MKKALFFLLIIIIKSCIGKDKFVMQTSLGKINKVMIVVKSSDWSGNIGREIRSSFGQEIVGLPQPEAILSVSQIPPKGFGSMMKAGRNIMIIGVSDVEKYFVRKNVYAKPQTIVYVYSKNDEGLIKMFNKHKKEIINTFRNSDIKMMQNVFSKSKIDGSKFKTLQKLGVTLNLHDKFRTVDDTGDFLWLRQHLSSGIAKTGSNNILVYSYPLTGNTRVADSIISFRNIIGKKYLPGHDPKKTYMITEKAYSPQTSEVVINGKKAYETRGKWEVKNDFMAGPFLNYTIIDKNKNRVIVFEGFTYAPSVKKRDFLFELEAIAKSININ